MLLSAKHTQSYTKLYNKSVLYTKPTLAMLNLRAKCSSERVARAARWSAVLKSACAVSIKVRKCQKGARVWAREVNNKALQAEMSVTDNLISCARKVQRWCQCCLRVHPTSRVDWLRYH